MPGGHKWVLGGEAQYPTEEIRELLEERTIIEREMEGLRRHMEGTRYSEIWREKIYWAGLGSVADQVQQSGLRTGKNSLDWFGTIQKSWFIRLMEGTDCRRTIKIASINIRSGWEGGLEAVLRAIQQGNGGIGILQDRRLTEGIHTHYKTGYKVWATEAEIRQRGRINIFWWE